MLHSLLLMNIQQQSSTNRKKHIYVKAKRRKSAHVSECAAAKLFYSESAAKVLQPRQKSHKMNSRSLPY